ncbi:MAG: NTP transferase domain-containing protein [Gemmatimonadaceae bacterium]|nr:NTP transferase domain-containing protein [Gemmatimonadaceae bacterium]
MRAIFLAAGRGYQMDGLNKTLIRVPWSGQPILHHLVEAVRPYVDDITVVVGYNPIAVMQAFPDLHYVHNAQWATGGSAQSLALALDERPALVCSADLILDAEHMGRLVRVGGNALLVESRELRTASAVHCALDGEGRITALYDGQLRDPGHPEAVGVACVRDASLLAAWRHACKEHPGRFATAVLPADVAPLAPVDVPGRPMFDLNTPDDYIRLLDHHRARRYT